MNNFSLTPKQRQFFETLKEYMDKNGRAPTVSELMKLCSFSSPRAVTQYLDALARKGLVNRSRYAARGIELRERGSSGGETVTLPVLAAAGCDHAAIVAQRSFDEYVCIPRTALAGRSMENLVVIKAVGDSMNDAGIESGDYVLVEITQAVSENDLVVALLDGAAVIKKLEMANNAIILRPLSTDPQYKPIIVNRNFHIFGKVVDVIRQAQQGELEVVPLIS